MNNTDKAKLDAAKRMLKGKIDVEEVSMMLDVPVETLMPIKEELEEEVRKVYDFNMGQVLYDNFNDTGMDLDMSEQED